MKICDTAALVGAGVTGEYYNALRETFDTVLTLPPDDAVAAAVSAHPDMICSVIGGKFICHRGYYLKNKAELDAIFSRTGLVPQLSDARRGIAYPRDIAFNALILRDALLANIKYTAPEVLEAAADAGYSIKNVRQGYAACSSLVCGDTVITADKTIADAARGYCSVLMISPGHIALPGYDSGFIGGCGGYHDGTAYFFGDILAYPDGAAIVNYLHGRGIGVRTLLDAPLTDFGGIKFARLQ